MPPRLPRRGQDAVDTVPRGLAAIGRKKPTPPITKPLQLRPDERTPAEKKIGDFLNVVLTGRKSVVDLWFLLQPHWHPAPDRINDIRWHLFNQTVTAASLKAQEWRDKTPRHCAAGERTSIDHCTARDTCNAHREHLGRWFDTELIAVRYLMRELPDAATAVAEQQATKKPRR